MNPGPNSLLSISTNYAFSVPCFTISPGSSTAQSRREKMTKLQFDEYRINGGYNPNEKIIPWNLPKNDAALVNWQKTIRVSKADYPILKDIVYGITWKEKTQTTLKSHDLEHLIDPHYVAMNPELDGRQQDWLYKVFQDILIAPQAKAICTKYLDSRDTRALWREICKMLDSSMITDAESSKILTFLTSVKFEKLNWRGTQESFILGFAEKARIYNEINPKDPLAIRWTAL